MGFLYGVLGTVSVLFLFGSGVFAGYKLRGRIDSLRRPVCAPAEEKELRELEAQQEAFRAVQNYTAEMAYGQVSAKDLYGGDEI